MKEDGADMQKHGVIIASPPNREKLIAEIELGDGVWAEISHDTGTFVIEILPQPKGSLG